ncbi:hypothetical protein BS78_09G121800 [Paspalum vaginatum]|nr:hypothetical protein BS78_09G121800 [Paspalum vaginatum]
MVQDTMSRIYSCIWTSLTTGSNTKTISLKASGFLFPEREARDLLQNLLMARKNRVVPFLKREKIGPLMARKNRVVSFLKREKIGPTFTLITGRTTAYSYISSWQILRPFPVKISFEFHSR